MTKSHLFTKSLPKFVDELAAVPLGLGDYWFGNQQCSLKMDLHNHQNKEILAGDFNAILHTSKRLADWRERPS